MIINAKFKVDWLVARASSLAAPDPCHDRSKESIPFGRGVLLIMSGPVDDIDQTTPNIS
jgi:hypothetical protein